jgi:4'-phosphopantetheinyl transferase
MLQQTVTVWTMKHPETGGGIVSSAEPDCLSAAEVARAARFHFPQDAARYRYFHKALRRLLSENLPTRPEPGSLMFDEGPHGKPQLRDFPTCHFNLTHSGSSAAVAISGAGPVGIDLEQVDESFPCREVAQNYFHGEEITSVQEAPSVEQATARFFRLWTAKEAVMKATGLGMTLEPQQIILGLDPATRLPTRIDRLDHPGCCAADWKLHFPAAPVGYALAVVTCAQVSHVRLATEPH